MAAKTPRTSSTALKHLAAAARKRGTAQTLERCQDRTGAFWERKEAAALEDKAQAALTLPEPPMLGVGAEAVLRCYPDTEDADAGAYFQDTLANPTLVTAQASFDRMQLALKVGCLEATLDAAETIQARNSLEKMLAGQLAAAHHSAMTFLAKSLARLNKEGPWESVETIDTCRLANTAARLMSAFTEGVQTLHKLRTGGRQVVIVQHV